MQSDPEKSLDPSVQYGTGTIVFMYVYPYRRPIYMTVMYAMQLRMEAGECGNFLQCNIKCNLVSVWLIVA